MPSSRLSVTHVTETVLGFEVGHWVTRTQSDQDSQGQMGDSGQQAMMLTRH